MERLLGGEHPDGIVIAADSLATAQNLIEFAIDSFDIECPNCHNQVTNNNVKIPSASIHIPFSASSYTQKLMRLNNAFSLSFFGKGVLDSKSIYYHVRTMQQEETFDNGEIAYIAEIIQQRMESLLRKDFPNYKKEAPDKWYPLGFHLNGYEGDQCVTYEIFIGKDSFSRKQSQTGCTLGGEMRIVQKLWEIGKNNPRQSIKYGLLSLQDAIDLSKFFIETTGNFQRFASEIQTVGGDIDIALITPFHGS